MRLPASRLLGTKGIQTGVDRRGRHICWDNITGFRVDCPEHGQEQNIRTRQPMPEPGEEQPIPGEGDEQQRGAADQAAQAQAQADQEEAQRGADRERLVGSLGQAMSCADFIIETTRHLLEMLTQADPMEREYLKQRLARDEAGQELSLRLAEACLPPGTGGGVIQTSPGDTEPRGTALDAEHLRQKVVEMQGCGAFVRDTFQGVLGEASALPPEQYQSLIQNLGLDEKVWKTAETLASGALQHGVGGEGQKGIGPNHPEGHYPHPGPIYRTETGDTEVAHPDEEQDEEVVPQQITFQDQRRPARGRSYEPSEQVRTVSGWRPVTSPPNDTARQLQRDRDASTLRGPNYGYDIPPRQGQIVHPKPTRPLPPNQHPGE